MSTYIPGIDSYVPQIQPFRPDYNLYGNVLQGKQNQYDSAHKQLSSVYGTLLNSPMSRDQNLERRDAFFKAIDQDIKKMSGMDLSLEENVNSANKVFESFYNDKNMVNDMIKTKSWMNELDRGNNFRACVDPEKCGGQFWEAGLQALHYKHEEFRQASDDQALRMDMGRYVPYQNFTDQAFKAAKDAGFNIKVDSLHGGYIVTTKNGQQLTPQLNEYFMSKFGDDPKMMDVFKTEAYVQRKNYTTSRAAILGSQDAADSEYINHILSTATEDQKRTQQEADKKHEMVTTRIKVAQHRIEDEGVSPNDEIAQSFRDLQDQFQITTSNKALQDKATKTIETASNIKDPLVYKDRIDDIVAHGMLKQHALHTANAYAMKDTEVSMKADPFALSSHESSLALRNMMAGKEADFGYDIKKMEYKAQLDEKKKAAEQDKLNRMLGLDNSKPEFDPNAPGAATPQITTTEQTNIDERNSLYGERNIDQRSFLKDMVGSMKAAYDAAGQADVKGGAEKQKLIAQTASEIFKGTSVDAKKLFTDQTYGSEFGKLDGLNITHAKSSYEKALNNVNPNSKGLGAENSFWSRSFWNDKGNVVEGIKVREKLIGAFDKQYAENSINARSAIAGKYLAQGEPQMADMAKAITSDTGRKLDQEEFARTYAEKNKDKYRPDINRVEGIPGIAHVKEAHQLIYNSPAGSITVKDGYQKAYEDAVSNYDKLSKDYSSTYQDVSKAYNGITMFNGKGGALATGGYRFKFEPAALDHNGTVNGYSVFKNYDQLKASDAPNLNVKFGETDKIGNDEQAKLVLDLLEQDSRKIYKPTDDKRPSFSFRSQEIAANNPNLTAVHFDVPEKWLAQYTKKNGLLAGIDLEEVRKGITLFIPKDKATNQISQDNQKDDYDRIMDLDGHINIDTYSDAGKIALKKIGNNYVATGHVNNMTSDGKVVPTTFYEKYNIDYGLKPSLIVGKLTEELKKHSQNITSYKAQYNAEKGIKNPAQLLSQ